MRGDFYRAYAFKPRGAKAFYRKAVVLGLWYNGAFALQFSEAPTQGYWAVAEGIFIMFLAGYMELRSEK